MLNNILKAISLGRQVMQMRAEIKQQVAPAAPPPVIVERQTSQMDALRERLDDFEALKNQHASRMRELENRLKDAAAITDALARRVSVIFWLALASIIVSLLALGLVLLLWLS